MSETANNAAAEAEAERGKLLRKAYGNATTELRENYKSEFQDLYTKHARALGVDYTPRPSAEEKAEQELQALLAAHPHLREKIAGGDESEVKEFSTQG